MHPIRRRKKRPNYGVRTVEVTRGKNGFGFTISGQQPCILSCIVAGSPAENAGLRAGDYLVAVDGRSVSKMPHDDVVRLIGCTHGLLKLQIAENYYSDSSDDDVLPVRPKPKYMHKPRSNIQQHPRPGAVAGVQDRVAKVVDDLRTGAMFEESLIQPSACVLTHWSPPPAAPTPSPCPFQVPSEAEDGEQRQFVVGYLGTIEIPKQLQPGSKPQIVCACIRKLRAEKRPPQLVLLCVLPGSVRLVDTQGSQLAEYPAVRVLFCGAGPDADRRHFGLVTQALEEEGTACHVFAVDPRLVAHADHAARAETFKLDCSGGGASDCGAFPRAADPVLRAVQRLYDAGNSPHPSNASSANSSNSDSGIGFRDDCGNQSDRVLSADVESQQRLGVRAMPGPRDPFLPLSLDGALGSPACCAYASVDDLSLGGNINNKTDSVKRHELSHLLSYKLSPKVFGVSRPALRRPPAHSLEDLTLGDSLAPLGPLGPLDPPQWARAGLGLSGSLQDLRSLVLELGCYDVPAPAPLAQPEHDGGPEDGGCGGEAAPGDVAGGVAAWSASFERLLDDPAGLHTFAEFLKKEFSHENIYFWVACERYRHLEDAGEREREAKAIFEKHLCLGAPEPVNVDSHARQVTQEQLGNAFPDLFLQAQKQIFNLMKFDSYPRFIKSELYKECLLREISGQELPFKGSPELDQGLNLDRSNKLKKSRSDVEDRRRKSLLPWHRKNRSKSKDRGETEYSKREQFDTVSIRSDVTSSRSSLASWDLALRGSLSRQSVTSGDVSERENSALCRVILPDGATTVVQTRQNETVSDLVQRLLEKRGLSYQHFQVFVGTNQKAVSPDEVSSVLSNKEVRVEPRVVFRLDLPNRKTVGVKSRPGKTLGDVLRPVLHKYGYRLHLVTVCTIRENEVVSLDTLVSAVDNQRLQVLTRSPEEASTFVLPKPPLSSSSSTSSTSASGPGSMPAPAPPPPPPPSVPSASLDEITNRVFQELLHGKTAPSPRPASDQGSVRSEDWGSEHSSGIFGRLLRRDSAYDKSKDFRNKGSKKYAVGFGSSKSCNTTVCSTGGMGGFKPAPLPPPSASKPPLIAKWKPGVKLLGQSESDELYEGLKRAQRSRLEDQRGTEINFELPDFLKDKENAPQGNKKLRKFLQTRREAGGSDSQSVGGSGDRESLLGRSHAPFRLDSLLGVGLSEPDVRSAAASPCPSAAGPCPCPRPLSPGSNGAGAGADLLNASFVIPSHRQAEEYFSGCSQPSTSPVSLPPMSRLSDPPPLPPKPKYLRPPAGIPAPALPRMLPRVPGGELTNRQAHATSSFV